MRRVGLYPGTFDPPTNGHIDIFGRAMKLVDELIIGVAVNESKKPLFTLDERVAMVKAECARLNGPGLAEIKVMPMHGLLMKFAEACGAQIIVRGLRAVQDFEYEFQMTAMNEQLNPDIETVFLMADVRHQAVASRLVKEIASLGGNITPFVTPDVKRALLEKYGK
ncbi:MAG: pantetheine-phosphate adenylyltransferase [Acidobacteria bacterium]|nr:pantetheine-phosphate adenylyltransferase [Acidobacteriota bacterium]